MVKILKNYLNLIILEIIAKYTNEYMELEKTVSETESAKAKVNNRL